MAARWTQLLAAVVTVSVAMATPDEVEELPKPAAHKQIIYRYIPIDKSFLGLDKAYDDFYKTGTSDETYAPLRNRDEYDRNSYYYNDDYDRYSSSHRRRDDYYRDSDRRRNEVDTYTTYSRDDHDHGHRRNDDYYNYDYDYSQDYSSGESSSSGRRPSRRRQRRPQRKDTGSSAAKTALDFVEAVGRRVFSLPKSWANSVRAKSGSGSGYKGSSGGGYKGSSGGGYKGTSHKGGGKKFSISFEAIITFITYLLGAALLFGYIALVVANAVASDGLSLNQVLSRSLSDDAAAGAANSEALRLLMLLESALTADDGDHCRSWQLCEQGQRATWKTLKTASGVVASWTVGPPADWLETLAELVRPNRRCSRLYPDCAAQQPPLPEPAERGETTPKPR